uniref:Uncharacterized protein n=1 Tax=Arundo donax TaxID=35708 RepID=A0A0A8YFU7_ARUDO
MDRAVDYDFYDDDELRYGCFKSPFDSRPLVGARPRLRKNAGKRTLCLVGSNSSDYMRQCEDVVFGDFDDWEDEDVDRKNTNRSNKGGVIRVGG